MVFESKMGLKTAIFLALVHGSLGFEMPKWSDIFKSLSPYEDGVEEVLDYEEGDPRIGFVQVGQNETNQLIN